MLVFLDESGDCGLKFDSGSSPLFTCVAVFFNDSFAAEACDRGIDELRRKLGLGIGYEFHFTHCNHRIRQAFLTNVCQEQFTYQGFVLNKRELAPGSFKSNQAFYDYVVGWVCENAKPLLDNAKLVIDKCGDRDFKLRLATALKRKVNDQEGVRIRKVQMEGSHTNNLLQLADMICGAVARGYASNDQTYRNLVKANERRIRYWPNKSR